MLLIGSRAAELRGIDLKRETSRDFDVIVNVSEAEFLGFDASSFHGNNGVYDYWVCDNTPLNALYPISDGRNINVASTNKLYSLKYGQRHIWRGDIKYSHKALWDTCVIKEYIQKDMIPVLENSNFVKDWHNFLMSANKVRKPRKLNETKESFFSDKVKYYYDHDSLHMVMAHEDEPMYKKHLKGEVLMNNDSFLSDTLENNRKQVLEEAYVIALERIVIHALKEDKYQADLEQTAFQWALCRICTNLCGGEFRKVAADNYKWLIENYNKDYLQTFFDKSSLLKKFKD